LEIHTSLYGCVFLKERILGEQRIIESLKKHKNKTMKYHIVLSLALFVNVLLALYAYFNSLLKVSSPMLENEDVEVVTELSMEVRSTEYLQITYYDDDECTESNSVYYYLLNHCVESGDIIQGRYVKVRYITGIASNVQVIEYYTDSACLEMLSSTSSSASLTDTCTDGKVYSIWNVLPSSYPLCMKGVVRILYSQCMLEAMNSNGDDTLPPVVELSYQFQNHCISGAHFPASEANDFRIVSCNEDEDTAEGITYASSNGTCTENSSPFHWNWSNQTLSCNPSSIDSIFRGYKHFFCPWNANHYYNSSNRDDFHYC
jgi:hypothetical protein